MKRKGIPPWLLVALGGMIAAYASFINNRLGGSAGMRLFIYVGLIIGVVGFGKIAFRWWETKGKAGEEKIAERIADVPKDVPRIINCRTCGAKNYNTSNYCHMCGMKLR